MAEILNLKRARKRRDRAREEAQAAANRVKFGRTKDEKARERAEAEAAQRKLDLLKLDQD